MGLSTSVASGIALIAFISLTYAMLYTFTQEMQVIREVYYKLVYMESRKLRVEISLEVNSVAGRSLNITVRNTGSEPIFLSNYSALRNDIIVAYFNSTWLSYLAEYSVLSIRVAGAAVEFDPSTHNVINPGEEAFIQVYLPSSAPEIPVNSTVTVVFVSHYGVTARGEGVRAG
ncbi:MAG: hypothetical protein J7L38_08240 [Thermoproteales archaeon]|nr:hypothetical protein [Thermoproteales archaeon]